MGEGTDWSEPRTRYCCLDVGTRLQGDAVLLRSERTGHETQVDPLIARILLSCNRFETLKYHAEVGYRAVVQSIATTLKPLGQLASPHQLKTNLIQAERSITRIESQLRGLAADGFLVSEADVRVQIHRACARNLVGVQPPGVITAVGIPTRDRPSSLSRALESLVRNTRYFGRTPALTVVDDSRDARVRSRNLDVLLTLRGLHGVEIFYAGPIERASYAEALARHAGVAVNLVRFAVLGEARCGATYGAARNSLLLHSVGQVCLQVDDDISSDPLSLIKTSSGLELSSRYDLHEYWFYRNFDEAVAAWPSGRLDFLGVHERLLTRTAADIIKAQQEEDQQVHIDEISGALLRKICLPGSRVDVTFIGSLGDASTIFNMHRLFLEGPSLERLAGDPDKYRDRLRTRYLLQAPTHETVTDSAYCCALNIGMDNRSLLPPFIPGLGHEDGVFGTLLSACFERSLKGHLAGCAVPHRRPDPRAPLPAHIGFEGFGANFIVTKMLRSASLPREEWGVGSLYALGRHLVELGSLSPLDFDHEVRRLCGEMLRGSIASVEHHFTELGKAAACVVDDLVAYEKNLRQAEGTADFHVPFDLPGNRTERLDAFRQHVRRFGLLLSHWPAIVAAARELQVEGILPAVPVEQLLT